MSNYDAAFKAKVALEALKENETLPELAKRFNVSQSKIPAMKYSVAA